MPFTLFADELPAEPVDRQARHRLFVSTFSYVGIAGLLGFAAFHGLTDRPALSLFQLAAAAGMFVNVLSLRRSGNTAWHENALLALLLVTLGVLLYVSTSGTGPLWFPHYAVVTFFLKGSRQGLVWLSPVLALLLAAMAGQALGIVTTPHSLSVLVTLTLSLVLLCAPLYIHELVRADAETRLARRTAELSQVVHELHEAQEQLRHLAHHDPLTGLANRTLLNQRLKQAIKLAERHQTRLGVLFLDLDQFKPINDRYGHPAGDAVLKEVARRLTTSLRESDTVARVGGDEFMVVINDVESQLAARTAADKLVAAIEAPYHVEGKELRLGVSVGLSVFPDHHSDLDGLMSLADVDMYRIKAAGRGRQSAH